MRRALLLLCAVFAVLAAPLQAQAQQETDVIEGRVIEGRVIEGRVTDAATGQPLPGASVRVAGTDLGTSTDAFGRYVLRGVPAGEQVTVVASFVGYAERERAAAVPAGEQATVDFSLEPDAAQLDEVVVQSEKFVRSLQETRTSVSVAEGETLGALAVQDWQDASRLVGNFSVNGFGGFSIRGISNTGVGFGGNGTTAQLYVDGVAQNVQATRAGARGTWDLEAVEVFRGPQSTVAGRNALAGSVHLRSKAPVFEWDAAGRLRGGSHSTREGALMLNAPIAAGQLALRVSGEYQFQDSGFEYTRLDGAGFEDFDETTEQEYANVRARLLFTPSAVPGLSARLSYSYAYDRPQIYLRATGPDFDARENAEPHAIYNPNRAHNASLEARYDLTGALTLTSISGLLANERTFDNLTYQVEDPAVRIPVSQRTDSDYFDLTQELRLNVETERLSAVVGGYGGRFAFEGTRLDRGDVFPIVRGPLEAQARELGLLGPEQPLPSFEIEYEATTPSDRESVNLAAFGEVNYDVLPGLLAVTAGLRYDRETYETASQQSADLAIPSSPFGDETTTLILEQLRSQFVNEAPVSPEATYEALLPKAGLTVNFTPSLSLGATVQRGYRAGGAEVLQTGEQNVYDPEFTWNYEASLRSRWLGRRLTVNANAFYTDWRDQQVRVPIQSTTLSRTENAGESTLYGAELELQALPARHLRVFGSAGLVHTEFDAFTLGGRDLEGYPFPSSPGETFSLGAAYRPPAGFFGALSASYTGESYEEVGTLPDGGNDPALRAGDYTLVGGKVGYAFDVRGTQTRVSLFGRNIFDEDAVLRRTKNAFGEPLTRFAMPRVVGLSLDVAL